MAFPLNPTNGQLVSQFDKPYIYDSTLGVWRSYAGSFSGASIDVLSDVDTSTTAPEEGQALVWDDVNSQWIPGTVAAGGGSAEDPTVTGPTSVNELSTQTYTISNYNASYAYIITITGGTVSRSGATITWEFPQVSEDTVHYLNIQSFDAGSPSSIVVVSVTVNQVAITDTSIIITDYASNSTNLGWAY